MRVVQVNVLCGKGSTGVIAFEISKVLNERDIENYILYSRRSNGYYNGICFSDKLDMKLSGALSRTFGNFGFNAHKSTLKLLKKLDELKPDIVHLHNLHSQDIDLKSLLEYLKNKDIRTIWTFHDCWAFTGYCTHYVTANCSKWQFGCNNCPQRKSYSFFFDRSKELYELKKELILGIEKLEIITPSEWMAKEVAKSFLKHKKIFVINNGIDLSVFRPRKGVFRTKQGLGNKKILLGIPKGNMVYFNELSEMLSDEYKLVLVGLKQKEIGNIPKNVLSVPYTNNPEELAEIYSDADVFINMTMADTFPTVNIEALACGTPVVTFRTGGSPETIDEATGIVVEQRDVAAVYDAAREICIDPDTSASCIERAHRLYNAKDRFNDYYELYCRTGRFK